jgi:hypothetical protein
MENVLWLVGRVNVDKLLGSKVAVFMVDRGIDHAISNGFGNNELGIDLAVQVKLGTDVSKANARVRQVDLAQAGLDNVAAKSTNQS